MNYYVKALKNYANFKGRARRKEFWIFTFMNILIYTALSLLAIGLKNGWLAFLPIIYSIFVILPTLAVSVRRIQDTGKEWFYIIIPIYNLILYLTPGDVGENRFGPASK